MKIEIRTVEDVRTFCAELLRVMYAFDSRRENRAAATTVVVGYAAAAYAAAHGEEIGETQKLAEWLGECWLAPERAIARARAVLGAVESKYAVVAIAESAPGTAWSKLATYEAGRRAGVIRDWTSEGGVVRVEKV